MTAHNETKISSQQHPLHASELSRLHHIFLYQQSDVELPVWQLFFGPKDVTDFITLERFARL